MPKTISEIYTEYKIMPNLQEHMLRVAAVAYLICDNFNEPINKEEIVSACLLHDMGNLIKFKLGAFPEFLEPEGLEYWDNAQREFKKKYGENEYLASLKIAQDIGVSNRTFELIQSISFVEVSKNASSEDFGKKIVEYCDDRVTPFGIVGLEDRLIDLRTRYAHRKKEPGERENFEQLVRQMEKQIFAKCKIRPEDINDETVKPIIAELKKFVVR